MKKQQDTPRRSPRSKLCKEVGIQIASTICEFKEQDVTMPLPTVHPIDTLLVNQLENILHSEQELRSRYSTLNSSDNTPEVRMAFSKELSELSDRADRLYRLINAMDYYGSGEPGYATAA